MSTTSSAGQEFVTLRDAMNQLLEDSFTPFWTMGRSRASGPTRALPLDVYSTSDEVVVIAAIPGVRSEDVDVSIDQGTLTISGTLANVAEAEDVKGATWYLHELVHGQFRRSVSLPVDVDSTKADATFADGILKLRLPKAERAKPRRIEVRLGGNESPAVEAGGTTERA